MELIRCCYEYDYGPEVRIVVGAFDRFNAIEILLSGSEFWTWGPNIEAGIGLFNGSVLSLSLVLFLRTRRATIWELPLPCKAVSQPGTRRDNVEMSESDWNTLTRLLADISHNPAAIGSGDQELFAELFARSLQGKGNVAP